MDIISYKIRQNNMRLSDGHVTVIVCNSNNNSNNSNVTVIVCNSIEAGTGSSP